LQQGIYNFLTEPSAPPHPFPAMQGCSFQMTSSPVFCKQFKVVYLHYAQLL